MTHPSTRASACAVGLGALVIGIVMPQPASASYPMKTSGYLAGYSIKPPGGVQSAKLTRFTVPTLDCSSGSSQGVILGIGNEPTVGVLPFVGGVWLECFQGVAYYLVQATVNNSGNQGTASAGDVITISFTQTASTETVAVTDVTTGSVTMGQGSANPDTTVTYGAFPLFAGDDTPIPVSDFGSISLRVNKINGAKLAGATRVVRKSGGTTQIKAGQISGGTFKLTFVTN